MVFIAAFLVLIIGSASLAATHAAIKLRLETCQQAYSEYRRQIRTISCMNEEQVRIGEFLGDPTEDNSTALSQPLLGSESASNNLMVDANPADEEPNVNEDSSLVFSKIYPDGNDEQQMEHPQLENRQASTAASTLSHSSSSMSKQVGFFSQFTWRNFKIGSVKLLANMKMVEIEQSIVREFHHRRASTATQDHRVSVV